MDYSSQEQNVIMHVHLYFFMTLACRNAPTAIFHVRNAMAAQIVPVLLAIKDTIFRKPAVYQAALMGISVWTASAKVFIQMKQIFRMFLTMRNL
jgi:hypothetical protein